MIYIYRFLWLIGCIPIYMIESLLFLICLLIIYPFNSILHYIRYGYFINTEYSPFDLILKIDDWYKDLQK